MPFLENLNPAVSAFNQQFSAYLQYTMRNKMFEQSLQGQKMALDMQEMQNEQMRKQMYRDRIMNAGGDIDKIINAGIELGDDYTQQRALQSLTQLESSRIKNRYNQYLAEQESKNRAGYAAEMEHIINFERTGELTPREAQIEAEKAEFQFRIDQKDRIAIPQPDKPIKPASTPKGRDPILDAQSKLNLTQDRIKDITELVPVDPEDPFNEQMKRVPKEGFEDEYRQLLESGSQIMKGTGFYKPSPKKDDQVSKIDTSQISSAKKYEEQLIKGNFTEEEAQRMTAKKFGDAHGFYTGQVRTAQNGKQYTYVGNGQWAPL